MLAGCFAAFLLAEVGLRVQMAVSDPGGLARTATSFPPPYSGSCTESGSGASLGELIRPSENPDLVYELKPNIDTCFYGARVTTNAEGLRAIRSYARPKPDNVYRVLLIGDSQTFGQGVVFEQTYGHLLEVDLNSRSSGKTVEVINGAVDGYNTYQEAAFLLDRGLEYEPDCVVILFIGNDFQLPAFLARSGNPMAIDRLYLVGLRRDLLSGESKASIPEKYTGFVGRKAYEQSLRVIARAAKDHSFSVINFVDNNERLNAMNNPQVWENIDELQARLGIAAPTFKLPWALEYWLSEDNGHMNPLGHSEIAKRMIEGMEATGVCIPDLQN